jgi:hypothetical protein
VALFSSTSNSVITKFLNTENIAASDVLPAVSAVTGTITKLTFSNIGSSPIGDIEIRKNQTAAAADITVSLGGFETEVFAVSLAVTSADELNCKIVGGAGVGKPLVKVYV